ncbi:MAG TPA: hypothetical protein VID50_03460, partial [Candidatus Eisenbacteria bacterium]
MGVQAAIPGVQTGLSRVNCPVDSARPSCSIEYGPSVRPSAATYHTAGAASGVGGIRGSGAL